MERGTRTGKELDRCSGVISTNNPLSRGCGGISGRAVSANQDTATRAGPLEPPLSASDDLEVEGIGCFLEKEHSCPQAGASISNQPACN
jgi:hypothetical protein